MKILHYINNLGSGGAEKLLTDILPYFKQEGNEVYLIISNAEKNFEKYEKILSDSEIKFISLDRSFYNPFQIFKLIIFIKKYKIDIVHAHLFPTQYWLAIASYFIPKSVILIKTEHNANNKRRSISFLRFIEKHIYSRYTNIIAITNKVKENLENWIGTNFPIIVVKNGVNLSQIKAEIDKGTTYQLNYNLFNLLMVGSLDGYQKDQISLIDSLANLPDEVHLFLVGTGKAEADIKKHVIDSGFSNKVTFLGLRKDVYALMNSVDLNILSSNHEGLSGVTLESMASGKPFIGSDVAGIKEIVPSPIFLFPPKNPKALAKKILEIKNDEVLKNKMVKNSLEHVKSFDTSLMVENYLKIYKDSFSLNKNT
ncbi:glycosyltransferase [Aequorivita xiaoshiensis]|uniref:Glycosyltransferase n=1 Tax=Aequorivita xiaoshiensis TaxID=2874476 RepID=A0A9X1R4E5_9FLAO|nr:glycosyltransferase [Aequorivita xiaoshiensis]MCG2431687.1 glycosyltransferase [Aequorivita xiaoshiensis]